MNRLKTTSAARTAAGLLAVLMILFLVAPAQAGFRDKKMIPASFSELAQKVKPGVVNIQTVTTVKGGGRVYEHFFGNPFGRNNPFDEFFEPFFRQQPNRKQSSLGSGFIIDKEGYIVTNNHVIDGADEIKVILSDKREFDAKIIGKDPATDLALIKITADDLHPLELGSSNDLDVGSWVVAVGSPFGLEQTVTAGIVSAKGRIIGAGPYDDFIQTDASINPGNSGGPLLNLDGEVVGINTAIVRSGQGIGFAIPSDLARGIIDQLIQSKEVTRGWMGVMIQDLTPDLVDYYGLDEQKGVVVGKVYEGDPADKAGIRAGDVIIDINGHPIEDSRDLSRTIAAFPVGEKITVHLIREGKKKNVAVVLEKRPESFADRMVEEGGFDLFGFQFKEMTPSMANRLNLPQTLKGLVVTEIKPDSKAAGSGIREGDVLIEINHKKVASLEDYLSTLDKVKKGKTVQLLFRRGNYRVYAVNFEK